MRRSDQDVVATVEATTLQLRKTANTKLSLINHWGEFLKAILLAAVLGIVAGAGSNLVSKIVYAAVVALCGLADLLLLRTLAALWDAVWVILAFNGAMLGMGIYGYFFPAGERETDLSASKQHSHTPH